MASYCNVCCSDDVQSVLTRKPFAEEPSNVVQKVLLNHARRCFSTDFKQTSSSYNSDNLNLPTMASEIMVADLKHSNTKRPSSTGKKSNNIIQLLNKLRLCRLKNAKHKKMQANEALLQWLCDVCPTELTEANFGKTHISSNIPETLMLQIDDKNSIKNISEELQDSSLIKKLCNECYNLLRLFIKHERIIQNIESKLFSVILKSIGRKPLKEKVPLTTNKPKLPQEDIDIVKFNEKLTHTTNDISSNYHCYVATPVIESCKKIQLSSWTIKTTPSKDNVAVKRKRGRPKKDKSNILHKDSQSDAYLLDPTKSKCPFCFKIYSIQNSLVHHCLPYRNTLHCTYCNIFSSTYIRFEKHLESFHQKKKSLHCQLPECNHKFISKPALVWHQHFHKIEERTPAITEASVPRLTKNTVPDITTFVKERTTAMQSSETSHNLENSDAGILYTAPNSYSSIRSTDLNRSHIHVYQHVKNSDHPQGSKSTQTALIKHISKEISSSNSTLQPEASIGKMTSSEKKSNAMILVVNELQILDNSFDLNSQNSSIADDNNMANMRLVSLNKDENPNNLNAFLGSPTQTLSSYSNPNGPIVIASSSAINDSGTPTQNTVQPHYSLLPMNAQVVCSSPDKSSDPSMSLDQHIMLEHRVGEHEYHCPVCNKTFFNIKDIIDHLNSHKQTELCKCEICYKKLKNNRSEELGDVIEKCATPQRNVSNWALPLQSTLFPPPVENQTLAETNTDRSDEHLCNNQVHDQKQPDNTMHHSVVTHQYLSSEPKQDDITPSIDRLLATTNLIPNETMNSNSEVLATNHDQSNPVLSYFSQVAHHSTDQELLRGLNRPSHTAPIDMPFTESAEENFIPTTENLSVVKALEGSGGNSLAPIEHLIGSVDDMNYFS